MDGLASVGTGIYDDPIASIQTLLPGNIPCQRENLAQGRGIRRMGERDDMLPWDDQDVNGCLCVQVAEGYGRFILRHQGGRNLSTDDLAENTVRGIIRH